MRLLRAAEYNYDELSRRTLLTLHGDDDVNVTYEYDIANKLTKLTNDLNDPIFDYITFAYDNHDKVGNRLSMKVGDANAHVYQYDNLYQLIYVDFNDGRTTNYYYDALGNRTGVNASGTVTSYDSNCLNQYISVGDVNYSYDKNGNLTNDGTYKYYYDCENRLTDVNDANDDPVASYKYDYQGRRVIKTIHNSQTTIYYCYDGDQVIAEYDGSNNLSRKFIYGPGIDEPICMIDVANSDKVYYYHFDGLGSVVALSDSNSNIVEKYSYDVYGEVTIRDANDQILNSSDYSNPYLFTGRRYDSETGLYYYRARYYDYENGRFLGPDPLGYGMGLNLYTYCFNNPTRFKDPTGLSSEVGPIEKLKDNINRKYVREKVKKAKLTIKTSDGKRKVVTVVSASHFQHILRNINTSGNKIVEFRYVGHGLSGGLGLSIGTGEGGITILQKPLPGQISLFTMRQLIQDTFDPQAKIELCGCFTARGVGPVFKAILPESEVWGYENIGHVSVTLNLSWSEYRPWKEKSGWTEVGSGEKGCP